MIDFTRVLTGHIKHALKCIRRTFNIHGVVFQHVTIKGHPRVHFACAQDHEGKEVVHLLGHKAFIYIQVSAAGSAEERSQQRFTPVSLLKQRSPSPTEMASGASLSGTLLDSPTPSPLHACTPHPLPLRIKQHHKK